jgi:hypothetical protein
VDTTTWLTAAVGLVPFAVSVSVDFIRERKEERELRADLSARAVAALEALARIELPLEELIDEEDQALATGDSSEPDLSELLLGKTQRAHTSTRGKKDGAKVAAEAEGRVASGRRSPARDKPPGAP